MKSDSSNVVIEKDKKIKKEEEKKSPSVKLTELKIKQIKIHIVGDTPLLMHKFSDRAKANIVDRQTGQTKQRVARDIKGEVEESIHRLPDGTIGFPASGFKKAMVEVAPYFDDVDKKMVRGSLHVLGNLVPIKFDKQVVNEANVKINRGMSGEVRYRPEFVNWSCELIIRFNESLLTIEKIVNLLNYAGFHIGVGDWTPQHNGTYGCFHCE